MKQRPSPELVALRKREIANRYRQASKAKGLKRPRSEAAWRVSELTKLFDHRYGPVLLPANAAGELGAKVMAHHLGGLRDSARRMSDWFQTCTPWMGLASRERLIRDATEHPLRWRADRLAVLLGVTAAERDELDLRTIGACDQTREERAAIMRERKRARDRTRRRTKGAKLRAEYERWSITSRKPWIAHGMSRAAWYRAGKP
jgi:hypothetical protein